MKIVIAIGGNALLQRGERGSAAEQIRNAERTARALRPIIAGNKAIITHGNGPQVGNILLQQAAVSLPEMPLDVCDAMTQGGIGYILQSALSRFSKKPVVALVTRAVVDRNDPAFRKPTKPIGPFYKAKIAKGMVLDAGRGYRKVVPSPLIKDVPEKSAIRSLLEKGFVVIAGGGGGVPVDSKGHGVEAVIDKDRMAGFLASELNADAIIFITAADAAYLDFNKPAQKRIARMSVAQAKKWLMRGEFAEGSMGPKIESAVEFLQKRKNRKAIICSIGNIKEAFKGEAGTLIFS